MSKDLRKILVVDDSPISQKVTRTILQGANYVILEAWDGDECLKTVKLENPDAILMDVILPDGDGKEVVRKLRKDPDTRSIPVIFATNTVKLADDKGNETIQIDGSSYRAFAKPLHHPKLLSVLRKEINRRRNGGKVIEKIL